MSEPIENPALPAALAAELEQHLNFAVLEKLLAHRREYLKNQISTPKKRREAQMLWGQIEEIRWLKGLRALAENVLRPKNSR